jgi:DNA-binding NarL/FixJ family response regulator
VGKFSALRRVGLAIRSMSSAFADPSPSVLPQARERHVAVVMAGSSCRDLAHSLLADAALQWPGTVAIRGVDDLANDGPDAVVLVADSSAPASMAVLRRIRRELPATRLVVVARDDGNAIAARQALNAGAEAFVRSDEVDHALAPALDAVMAGLVCAPRAARRLVAKPTFSHREKEVLQLLVAGLTNRQIGARLYLAESTVKSHLSSAYRKLGASGRKDAAAMILDPDEGLGEIVFGRSAPEAAPPGHVLIARQA